MSTPNLLAGAALAVAALSLGWNLVRARAAVPGCDCAAAIASAAPAAAPPPGGPSLASALPIAISQLDARVRKLEEARPAASPPVEPTPVPAGPAARGSYPPYASFATGNPAVKVEQDSSGNIAVRNSDPALAYKMMLVEARRADGSVDHISILVPPVEK